MKKRFYEMDFEEAKKIITNNKHLMEKIRNVCDDIAYDWVNDILCSAPRGIDYEIQGSGYGYSYVSFRNVGYSETFDYLIQVNNDFCVFGGIDSEDNAKLEKALRYFDIMEDDGYTRNIKEKDFRYMEDFVDATIKELSAVLRDYLVSFYDYDEDYAIQEAIECDWLDGYYYDTEDQEVYKESQDYVVY